MSASVKTASKGGTKSASNHQSSGKQSQTHKGSEKSQRAARANADNDVSDEVGIRKSVLALMETTCRTEEEVCSALHDCDNDIEKACDMLLENHDQSQWQTNEKKKKKAANTAAPNATNASDRENEDWSSTDKMASGPQSGVSVSTTRDNRSSSRGRPSGRPYRGRGGDVHGGGGGGGGGGAGSGGDDPEGMPPRTGGLRRGPMGRGGGRGGGRGSSRGGRGPRPPRGSRLPQNAEESWIVNSNTNAQEQQENWGDSFPAAEDWDNEEWSGSLADTKVFTPSTATASETATITNSSDITPMSHIVAGVDHSLMHHSVMNSMQQELNDYPKQNSVLGQETTSPPPAMPSILPQDPAIYGYTNSTHLPKSQSPVAMSVTGALSAAQSQYLSQLTQKSEPPKQDRVMMNSQMYNTNYGIYGGDSSNPRKPIQRARVPPPSKIPDSAVEMPGDLGSSSIGKLDVQFGALDFGTDANSFLNDGVTGSAPSSVSNSDKYATSSSLEHVLTDNTNGSVSNQQIALDTHQISSNSLSNDVSAYSSSASRTAQMMSSDCLSTGANVEQNVSGTNSQYGTVVSRSVPPSVSTPHSAQLTTVAGLEGQLTGKSSGVSDISSQQSSYSTYPVQTTPYGVSQPTKQTYHTHHGYPANPYSQVNSSATSFTAASSIASGYPPSNNVNQYQHVSHTQQLNSYPSSSMYGGSGLYTSSVPYNTYQALQNNSNKISSNVKDSQYETAATTANLSISHTTQSTQSTSKVSSSSGKTNSSSSTSVMNSASAGTGSHVGTATVMGQYMISPPYYAQQPLPYPYEEVQIVPQRIAHHIPNAYYDVGYGTGGGAAGAGTRDAPIPSFAGSLTAGTPEARFGRGEAPSPQAVVGGAAGAGTAQPPQTAYAYAYTYSGNMLPAGSYPHYGTQTIYPIPTAGGTGSSSYGGGKGVGVGSAGAYVGSAGTVVGAYGAPAPTAAPPPQAYESVQQPSQPLNHQQDYKSGGYSSNQQSSGVKQGVNNSSSATSDLNSTMYGGKSHVSLSKVNSYDKAYHSATPPPPFGIGATAGGVANVGAGGYTGAIYLPHAIPPPSQQHQMDVRVNNNHRRDNGTNNSRGGSSGQSKQGGGSKQQNYSQSYWAPN